MRRKICAKNMYVHMNVWCRYTSRHPGSTLFKHMYFQPHSIVCVWKFSTRSLGNFACLAGRRHVPTSSPSMCGGLGRLKFIIIAQIYYYSRFWEKEWVSQTGHQAYYKWWSAKVEDSHSEAGKCCTKQSRTTLRGIWGTESGEWCLASKSTRLTRDRKMRYT